MITLVCGPMFGGKTNALLTYLERAHIAGKSTILLRPKTDTRMFLSHSLTQSISWLEERFVENLKNINIKKYDCVGIDEGQFMDYLPDFCRKYAPTDKNIIISGLSASSECEMFDNIVQSIPFCDKILKLNAVCVECGSEFGSYTHYTAGWKKDKICVGDAKSYSALCAKCYFKKNQ